MTKEALESKAVISGKNKDGGLLGWRGMEMVQFRRQVENGFAEQALILNHRSRRPKKQ